MKNKNLLLAFFLFAILAVMLRFDGPSSLVSGQGAGAQEWQMDCLYSLFVEPIEGGSSVSCTSLPLASPTPSPTPTLEPTSTPTSTPTVEPTPTNTPVAGTGPRDGVALCVTHNDTEWHPVYDAAQDCHYDHHHGRDPYDPAIVALLGSPDEYTGQSISYPWDTPDENNYKHRAYFWIWQINDECVSSLIGDLCVKAFRTQLHGDMGVLGASVRFHSYWFETLACEIGTDNCGVLKTGGWLDYGCNYDAYFGDPRSLPDQDPPACAEFVNKNPYRVFNTLDAKDLVLAQYESGNWPAREGTNQGSAAGRIIWANGQLYTDYAEPTMVHLVFSFLDNWAVADVGTLDNWEYICPDFQCPFNGSFGEITNYNTPKQPGGSDFYWTDRRGFRNDSCTETGFDCVPYVRENWPRDNASAGYHRNRQYAGGFGGYPYHPRDPRTFYEFDQSPAQLGTGTEWWLVPTNHVPLP